MLQMCAGNKNKKLKLKKLSRFNSFPLLARHPQIVQKFIISIHSYHFMHNINLSIIKSGHNMKGERAMSSININFRSCRLASPAGSKQATVEEISAAGSLVMVALRRSLQYHYSFCCSN